jgi:hypothetical protein
MDSLPENNGTELSSSTAQTVLRTAQLLYPVILLLTFVISAGVHTIITSKTEEELVGSTVKGPGGKPLPVTKRKREQETVEADDDVGGNGGLAWTVFLYLTGAIILSFVANSAAIALHAMKSSSDSGIDNAWWCGEARIVSFAPPRLRVLTETTCIKCMQCNAKPLRLTNHNPGLHRRFGIPVPLRPYHAPRVAREPQCRPLPLLDP